MTAAASLTQGSDSIAFTYDSDHQRVTQRATIAGATSTTAYLNDPVSGAQSLSVQSAGGISTTDYLSVDGQIVAQRVMSFNLSPFCIQLRVEPEGGAGRTWLIAEFRFRVRESNRRS